MTQVQSENGHDNPEDGYRLIDQRIKSDDLMTGKRATCTFSGGWNTSPSTCRALLSAL